MSLYFKNPPKKKGKSKGRKKPRTAKQKAATAKLVRLNKAKHGKPKAAKKSKPRKKSRAKSTTTRKSTKPKSRKRGAKKMAKKRKTHRRKSGNITLRRVSGKVYRSNPPILKAITGGLKDGALVKVGQMAGTMVSGMVPVTGLGGTAVKAVVAGLMGFAPVAGDSKRFLIAGAMQPVLDDLLALAGLGHLASPAGVSAYLPGSDGVSAYLSGVTQDGAYTTDDAVGAYVDY